MGRSLACLAAPGNGVDKNFGFRRRLNGQAKIEMLNGAEYLIPSNSGELKCGLLILSHNYKVQGVEGSGINS